MKFVPVFLCQLLLLLLMSFDARTVDAEEVIRKIAFGSCIKQDQPAPVLQAVVEESPEVVLFTGDNIYADTDDMALMREKYATLDLMPAFQKLRRNAKIFATWDDHDYGVNDGGADFAKRVESASEFKLFWRVPNSSPVMSRLGVYDSHVLGPPGKRLQIILLDTRYFRSPLTKGKKRVGGPYYPDSDSSKTMLGATQWDWLEQELSRPAEVRLVVSSVQFVAEAAGQECWANLPHERNRMIELIKSTKANGVVFISGDRHWSEISQLLVDGNPIYDVTCSSLNQPHPRGAPTQNEHRVVPQTYHKANYGILEIDWSNGPKLTFSIRDQQGKDRINQVINVQSLKRK